MAVSLCTITGSLYHPSTGNAITAGKLLISPTSFIVSNGELVSAVPIEYTIPGNGSISLALAYSGGVPYVVEFDADPNDTSTPLRLKSGYFKDSWLVPSQSSESIQNL